MVRRNNIIPAILFSLLALSVIASPSQATGGTSLNDGDGRTQARNTPRKSQGTARPVVDLGNRTTYLKAGLSIEDVISVLGKPILVRRENGVSADSFVYVFARGDGRTLVARFSNSLLTDYKITNDSVQTATPFAISTPAN
jgi:hypothetical protein